MFRRIARDEDGSSPVEFVLVGTILTILTLAILQLGLAMYVRNVVHDAAAEGAHYAALADTGIESGAARTADVITTAIGGDYAEDITVSTSRTPGHEVVVVRVRTTLPVLGLVGIPFGLEVEADAPMESLGEG
ncbi:pilus assembly protein [Microbacterium sp. M28]|uniref:TadE/TadG family type IV pilus assembly protein n=1 Tax=Microbacterium sp. M28 TaxID=2962064 RepID=UPI0021F44347|nr:TadE family protein [Microbacterium sp. M28]UYO96045.1 pilus assembly protein [Microbacterium sp. M28]